MPEKPECEIIAYGINSEYSGKLLVHMDHSELFPFKGTAFPFFTEFKSLLPLTLVQVWSKGKKIIFDFGSVFLIGWLGLKGKWISTRGTHSHVWLSFGREKDYTNGKNEYTMRVHEQTLFYDDVQRYGGMKICLSVDDLNKELDELGPDILNDEISAEEWKRKFTNSRIKNKQVCDMLTCQKKFSISGPGNYLKAEICYEAKINPSRILSSLSQEEIEELRIASIEITRRSYECQIANFVSLDSYYKTKKECGFECLVYKKKTDPLGNDVQTDEFKDGRTTYWVPAIQL